MSFTEEKIVYFDKPGKYNTDYLLESVKKFAENKRVKDIVVASTTGETGAKASKIFRNYNLVVVTHSYGWREPGKIELHDLYKKEILKNGGKIFTGTLALMSVERAIRQKYDTIQPLELMASTFRSFGEGTKVCVEIILMAADSGLIPIDKDIIGIGGTGRGADTALLIKPAYTREFFNLKIKEIIAKPNNFDLNK